MYGSTHMRRVKYAKCAIVALSFLHILAGCAAGTPWVQVLELELPARPAAWRDCPVLEYRIEWIDAASMHRSVYCGDGEGVRLEIARGIPQWIVATPVSGAHELRPAAVLYPSGLAAVTGPGFMGEIPKIRADFSGGYAAAVAGCIEKAGYRAFEYPCDRLAAALETLSGDSLIPGNESVAPVPDPWSQAPETVAASLLQGNFRMSSFRIPGAGFELPENPGGEGWYPESPFCSTYRTGEGGQSVLLCNGLHCFFSGSTTLLVRVEGDKVAAWQLRQDTGSGSGP